MAPLAEVQGVAAAVSTMSNQLESVALNLDQLSSQVQRIDVVVRRTTQTREECEPYLRRRDITWDDDGHQGASLFPPRYDRHGDDGFDDGLSVSIADEEVGERRGDPGREQHRDNASLASYRMPSPPPGSRQRPHGRSTDVGLSSRNNPNRRDRDTIGRDPPSRLQRHERSSDHLPPILVTNRRFERLLSIERYRLPNRDHRQGPVVTRTVNKWAHHLRPALEPVEFNGEPPIAALQWIMTLVRLLRDTKLSEGAGIRLWPHFLKDSAREEFITVHEDCDEDLGGVSTWPEAVHWLLTTYAREEYLQDAADKLEAMRQQPGEREEVFAGRLRKQSRVIAGAYSTEDLMGLFQRGTTPEKRALLRIERPKFTGPTAFHDFVSYASALGQNSGITRRPSTPHFRVGTKAPGRTVNHLELQRPVSAHLGNTIALAHQGEPPSGFLQEDPHPEDTLTSNGSSAAATSYYSAYDGYEAPPEGTTPMTTDSLLAMTSGPPTQPFAGRDRARPGGRQARRFQSGGDQSRNGVRRSSRWPDGTSSIPDICFECFQKGHRRPFCPTVDRGVKDDAYLAWVAENFRRLNPVEQRTLRSWGQVPVAILLQEARDAGVDIARRDASVVHPPPSREDDRPPAPAPAAPTTARNAVALVEPTSVGTPLPRTSTGLEN